MEIQRVKNQRVRLAGSFLVLALVPGLIGAQRPRPSHGETPPVNSCTADGAWCLFGSVGGCTASCLTGKPHCAGARCQLGFPIPSSCTCV